MLRLAEEDTCILHVYKLEVALDNSDVTCDQVEQPDVTPTECIDNVAADHMLWMDRTYAWTTGPSDILTGGWSYFRVSLEPGAGAPCSDPANPTRNGREGGFNGNIARDATIAICCGKIVQRCFLDAWCPSR